jgi:hypothetical protein
VGQLWVTRKGVKVDRIASAWLIRRFIDRNALFAFVDETEPRQHPGGIRFDMFDCEFTHEGDLCTFEVLLSRKDLRNPALQRIAEVVHDIDLKDQKYRRPETEGVASLIAAIVGAHSDDAVRIARGSDALDALHASLIHQLCAATER